MTVPVSGVLSFVSWSGETGCHKKYLHDDLKIKSALIKLTCPEHLGVPFTELLFLLEKNKFYTNVLIKIELLDKP